jgi:peptidoglycan-associated lipoprotein
MDYKGEAMMKKTLCALFAASFLWACSSDPPKEGSQAAVEERGPSTPKPPAGADTGRVDNAGRIPTVDVSKPQPLAGNNPLRDPNNILSKRSIFYDYDSETIKDEYRPMLQAHAKYLADNPNARMLIQGNCDERGGREYNLALGQRRAEAVKRLLVIMGARDGQIESVSLGEEKPRCEEKTDACYAQNRRSDMLHSGEF